jgi:hypothetical protein
MPALKRLLSRLLLGMLIAGGIALGLEVFVRIILRDQLEIVYDERNLMYRYDALLGWFPRESSSGFYEGSTRIRVVNNRLGFRDVDHPRSDRPTITFVGDSFVWGYDVEAEDRFTDRLRPLLPGWEIVNLGVSGYGTAQELLLLQRYFARFRPKIVFLVYQQHDDADNQSNQFYWYYRPYYELEKGRPVLRGVPVPKSIRYYHAQYRAAFSTSYLLRALAVAWFVRTRPPLIEVPDPTLPLLRQIRDFLSDRGTTLVIGLEGNDQRVRRFCAEQSIRCVNLWTPLRFPGNGQHWTPAGQAWVADKVREYLKRELAVGQ